uniref:Peptidase_M13 domain-containing protein n=1 Tax=Caenorhabditis japonica TaxID=281687 RepID=A0A8R1DEZ0_CAEJA
MRSLFFFCLCVTVSGNENGFDYIEDSYRKYANKNTDPCDNFYRHACPLGSPDGLLFEVFSNFFKEKLEKLPNLLNQYSIAFDFREIEKLNGPIKQLADLYQDLCEKEGNTSLLLEQLEPYFSQFPNTCNGQACLLYIQKDPDCQRGADNLRGTIRRFPKIHESYSKFSKAFRKFLTVIKVLYVHVEENVQNGLQQTKYLLAEIKEIVHDWIKSTPWAINNNVEDATIAAISPTIIQENYTDTWRSSIEELGELDISYKECKSRYNNFEKANVLCFFLVAMKYNDLAPSEFFTETETFISHPYIGLSFENYYIAQHSQNMASKIGYVGFTIGHELSHILIKSTVGDYLTYFSKAAKVCIQNQFNSTCEEFKEESCVTGDHQLDDNGADILGAQLAYYVLERHFGDDLMEIHKSLGIPQQQLFFYAIAYMFCDVSIVSRFYDQKYCLQGNAGKTSINHDGTLDEHSADYTRVNAVMSQLPGFQKAFECSEDSRMITSATEQCDIYGKNAPENKRH